MDRPSRETARRVGVLVVVLGLIAGFGFLNSIAAAPALADLGHPGAAAGAHAVGAPPSAASSARVSPLAPVVPVLTLTPSTGVVGITVTANGTNFTAATKITTFTFNKVTPATQTCTSQTTSSTGFFSCTFVVPANVPGNYNVSAVGSNGVPDNATAVFTIPAPMIALSPSTGASSTQVAVSGSGFTRLDTIATFTFNKVTPTLQTCVGQAIAGDGTWSCEFVVPSDLPGPYNVSAVGSDGVPDNATAVFTIPATSVTAYLETPLSTYTILPFNVILAISSTNSPMYNWVNSTGVDFANTWLWLNISDYVTNAICGSNNISAMITNVTASPGSSVVTEYLTFALTTAFFANDTKAKGCTNLLSDPALFNLTATVNGGPNGVGSATGYQYGFCSAVIGIGWCVPTVSSFVFSAPTSQLNVVPVAGVPYTYTLSATYSGQYVGKVQLTVYNPTGTAVILTKNLRYNGTTPTFYNWTQSTPAVYPYTLAVATAFGTFATNGVIVVSPATFVYTNETQWTNSTLVPGLSSGGAGTLLLLVGLIVGMIVALLVGRQVWAGPKPAGPAQPWTQQPGATNQCSVCGRSFATPEELAAHSKSEHGMQ